MANLKLKPEIKLSVDFTIDELEARALHELTKYSVDDVIAAMEKGVSTSFVREHRAGLVSFLRSIGNFLPNAIARTTDARKVFDADYEDRKTAMHSIDKLPS